MKRHRFHGVRLGAVVAGAFASLALLTLAPDAWAVPGLMPAHQTIPTRTPDRRTRSSEDTAAPAPTDTELPATPTAELASPTPTSTEEPTATETSQVPEVETATPTVGEDTVLASATPTPTSQETTETPETQPARSVATPLVTFVVITSVPTPANGATAVARAAQATALAQRYGTATPLPSNWVTPRVVTSTPTPANDATADRLTVVAYLVGLTGTPTPTPANMITATPSPTYFVITSVPTPGNAATAVAWQEEAAARAEREGTPTPLPDNWVTPRVVTPTPTPVNDATVDRLTVVAYLDWLTGTPRPTPVNVVTATPSPTFYVITSVPTPANAATAEAWLQEAAARAQREGTPTPLPRNWVTPIVVTPTPTPANQATADRLTVVAYLGSLTGTPTPTPLILVTPTPTPLTADDAVTSPTATSLPTWTPTATAVPIPAMWSGRIVFVSDRNGGTPAYYVMDADGGNVQQLSGPGLYATAQVRDTLDPNGQYQVFVSTPRNPSRDPDVGVNTEISVRRLSDGFESYLTGGTKGADYEPAYCQANSRYIVYTSQQSGGDDLYVVDLLSSAGAGSELRTTRLTVNDWPWDKHASWSPDCKQIVFYSNRDGHKQIYVMDFLGMDYPGGDPRNVSNSPYNDWDPVWLKPSPSQLGSRGM
jgi:WD40-like Beta Propeller Repeat